MDSENKTNTDTEFWNGRGGWEANRSTRFICTRQRAFMRVPKKLLDHQGAGVAAGVGLQAGAHVVHDLVAQVFTTRAPAVGAGQLFDAGAQAVGAHALDRKSTRLN